MDFFVPPWDGNDFEALDYLEAGFNVSRGGIIYPKQPEYAPDVIEWSAINYLCDEWDYAYAKGNPDA